MKAVVAIPAYTGQIHLGTMRSLQTDLFALARRGDSATVHDECGNALIADARALIVSQFLAGDADQLVFVDSDVLWEAGALVRLLDHPVDFVAGIYPQRRDPINYCVSWDPSREELWADENTGLVEVHGVPAGFMKLTRKMLERMSDAYRDLTFYCEQAPDHKAVALFSDYWFEENGTRLKLGEDYAFCRRWRDLGGSVWIDPEIKMGHVGYKTFEGHLGNYLRGTR